MQGPGVANESSIHVSSGQLWVHYSFGDWKSVENLTRQTLVRWP